MLGQMLLEGPEIRAIVAKPAASADGDLVEQAFRTVEQDVRLLIENALHITVVLDGDAMIRYVSPAAQRVLGCAPHTLEGRPFLSHVHPDDAPAVARSIGRSIHDARTRELLEFRCRDANGSWHVLEAVANVGTGGSVRGIVINARDVTERKWSAAQLERSLAMLVAIHEAGGLIGASRAPRSIGAALLEGARCVAGIQAGVILWPNARGQLRVWQAAGPRQVWERGRRSRAAAAARRQAVAEGSSRFFSLPRMSDGKELDGWSIPVRLHDQTPAVLEVYGIGLDLQAMGEALGSLADQCAGALDRARLSHELAEREQRLERLIPQMLLAQEEERRRVAYEVHDGLAQLTVAAQQHLEGLASRYHPRNPNRRTELNCTLELVRRTVAEARRLIAGLRPTVLDSAGLGAAIEAEVEMLRADGWHVEYDRDGTVERLAATVETAVFRAAQEAMANVRKHAGRTLVRVKLERRSHELHLEVRDWGRGFHPGAVRATNGPSERVGLVGMRDRIALLGGRCSVCSRPGLGTRVVVDVPVHGSVGRVRKSTLGQSATPSR